MDWPGDKNVFPPIDGGIRKTRFQGLHTGSGCSLRLGQALAREVRLAQGTVRAKVMSQQALSGHVELIGKVFGPGPQGEIIVRAERPWRYGEGVKVVDRRGRALGRVEGIVGPAA